MTGRPISCNHVTVQYIFTGSNPQFSLANFIPFPGRQERKKMTIKMKTDRLQGTKPIFLCVWYGVYKDNSKTGATEIFQQNQQCLKTARRIPQKIH